MFRRCRPTPDRGMGGQCFPGGRRGSQLYPTELRIGITRDRPARPHRRNTEAAKIDDSLLVGFEFTQAIGPLGRQLRRCDLGLCGSRDHLEADAICSPMVHVGIRA